MKKNPEHSGLKNVHKNTKNMTKIPNVTLWPEYLRIRTNQTIFSEIYQSNNTPILNNNGGTMKNFLFLFVILLVATSGTVYSDVFASRIKITNPDGSPFDGKLNDGSGAKFWYYLNDTSTAVVVKVINKNSSATVATINAGAQGVSSNPNSVTWDGSGSANGEKYYISIATTGIVRSADTYTSFYFQATSPIGSIAQGIFTRGVDINNNMETPGFGYWYASNTHTTANDGYLTGLLRYNPDGSFAGTNAGHPILTNTLDSRNTGGSFNWGLTAPWTSAVDSKGRIYQVSNGNALVSPGFITRLDNDTAAPKIIKSNINSPRGVYAHGEGANLKLYIAADTVVWRANIGNDDTLMTPLELVASLGAYVRDVIIDDAGFLIATLRTGTTGVAPGYIERYDISGGLPKKRTDATFSITHSTGQPVCLVKKSGPNKTSASDDTIYYSIRGASAADEANLGIHQITTIDGFYDVKRIFKSGDVPSSIGGNNNANADLALDWAGNIVWFENSNEEIFMVATPRSGATVTLTTQSLVLVDLSGPATVIGNGNVPTDFVLNQNYPNPFNPSTMISYTLPTHATVSVVVYDVLGNVVSELFNGEAQQGYNAVVWNGTNSLNAKVSSGMYLYRVSARLSDGRSFSETKRMLMLK